MNSDQSPRSWVRRLMSVGVLCLILIAAVYLLLSVVLADVFALRSVYEERDVATSIRVSYRNGDVILTFVDPVSMIDEARHALANDVAMTSREMFDLNPDARIVVRFVASESSFLFWTTERELVVISIPADPSATSAG
ncbi:MAG: hypothetical protein AAF525_02260 [Pseudomonadota bacterium]